MAAKAPLTVLRNPKGKLPRLPFAKFRDEILGSDYELSICFVTPTFIQKLNKTHRKKSYVPNVLAFSLEKKSGEIYACLSQIKKDAPKHSMQYELFLPFLVIHSMLHLKGYAHGSKMEQEEARLMQQFKL